MGVFLAVYIVVALVNYSVVQHFIGIAASSYFSQEWNTHVSVKSVNFNILDHVILRGIEMYTPEGDSVFVGEKIAVRFNEFPFSKKGLKVDRVLLKNSYYCFEKYPDNQGINLNFIINHYKKDNKDSSAHNRFVVSVNELVLRNVEYQMYLPGYKDFPYSNGVNVKGMNFKHINAVMKNIRVDASYISTTIEQFSAKEKSGFTVHNLRGYAYVAPNAITLTKMDVLTDDSHIKGSAALVYDSWEAMHDYINNVLMVAEFDYGSYGGLKDATYWAPMLWGFDGHVDVEGKFYGTVADMHAQNANLTIGNTNLIVNGFIKGLPNIDETVIKANIDHLSTGADLLSQVSLPHTWGTVKLPKIVDQLGNIEISGIYHGLISDFTAMCNLRTKAGNIIANANLSKNDTSGEYMYQASLSSPKFSVNKLLPNNWITSTGFDLIIDGEGFDLETMRAEIVSGLLFDTRIRQKNIQNIEITGAIEEKAIETNIIIDDSIIGITLYGGINMQDEVNTYMANAYIKHINLSELDIWKTQLDTNITIGTTINANIHGNNLDELYGNVIFENTKIQINETDSFSLSNMAITARELDSYKNVTLDCDLLHFETKGYFRYSDFGRITQRIFNLYIPDNYNIFLAENNTRYSPTTNTDAEFEFTLQLLDTTNQIGIFIPGLYIENNTSLKGSYSYAESLKFMLTSKNIAYKSVVFDNLSISGKEISGIYNIVVTSPKLYTESITLLNNMNLSVNSTPKIVQLALEWNDMAEKTKNYGDINIDITNKENINYIDIKKSNFAINGEKWIIDNNNNSILLDTNLLMIKDLVIAGNNQSLSINSDILKGEKDSLNLIFNKFSLDQFNALLKTSALNMSGKINGDLNLKGLYTSLYFDAELNITDWKVNNQDFGNANITSNFDTEMECIHVTLQSNLEKDNHTISPLTVSGEFFPMKNDNNLDFDINFDGFSLKSLEPFLSSFSSRFEGDLHGQLSIAGSIKQPQITGSTMIDNGMLKVDYSNTAYFFADSIMIDNQNIVFNNFRIKDEKDNIAYINGNIYHQFLKNFRFNIRMNTDNLLIVNTTQSENLPFYGTVYAKANVLVGGTDKNITIDVDSKTNNNSNISIPINDKKMLTAQNFIQFVQRDSVKEENLSFFERNRKNKKENYNPSKTNYKITLNIEATPEARVTLPMDFSSIKAVVTATGNGDLQMTINSDNPFSMMGDYKINNGLFKIDFVNLIEKELKLENGSSLSWTGDPANATININGIYEARVSLASLTGANSDMSNVSNKTVNVESIISLTGNLSQPKIGFDFRMPNADQSTEEEVYALIDRSNEREMINQTVALLLTGNFLPVSGTSNDAFLSNGLGSGVELVTNQVSSIISNMIKVVDVNFQYKSQTNLSSDQLNIDISKEWNKFYFETTFGWGGNLKEVSGVEKNTNNLIGDMLIGYKINPYLHVIVFNRSNVNDYTKQNLPYTQGVGLKFTHSFDSWKNLFRKQSDNNQFNNKK